MINGFDVPKLYLHKFQTPMVESDRSFEYAMIDGKQRTEAIFDFIKNQFALDSDFKYLHDEDIELSGLRYRELARRHPDIKQDFDSFTLDVITIDTDDIELIEDLFSRLNEAIPLNAAEKRNARPGPLPLLVREISRHRFFTKKLPFENKRYRHYDIIAKMLFIASREKVVDTKKAYLDSFFGDYAGKARSDVKDLKAHVEKVLDLMAETFIDMDPLLRPVGMISLYFLLFNAAMAKKKPDMLSHAQFKDFEDKRQRNRTIAEEDISKANYNLLEFDRFAQSPNDGTAMRFRLAVLDRHLCRSKLGFADDGVLSSEGEGQQ